MRCHNSLKLLYGIFIFLCFSFRIVAQNLEIQIGPAAVFGNYSPDSEISFTRTITVRHRGPAASYFITVSAGQSGIFTSRNAMGDAESLQYQVYNNLSDRNILKDLSVSPSIQETLAGSFAASVSVWKTQILSFTVCLLPGQLPAPGIYADNLILLLYEGTPDKHKKSADNTSLAISVTMNPVMDISLSEAGTLFNLAGASLALGFGVLEAGGNRSANLIVRANVTFTITVSSQYGGVLKTIDPLDSSQVPYAFTVDSLTVPLPAGTPQRILTSAPATSFSGISYQISVTIGSVGWVSEGEYSDIITILAIVN
jgi:hypothetical protein